MGRIENKTYKNIFVIPDDGTKTLEVYMKGNKLCREMFELRMNKSATEEANIYAGLLEQNDFNTLIDVIKLSTNKPTCITFIPKLLNDDENNQEAYTRYINEYRKSNAKDGILKHFPDNILLTNTAVINDGIKENFIKGLHM